MKIKTNIYITYGISMCTGENRVTVYIRHELGNKTLRRNKYNVKCNGAGMNMLSRLLDNENYRVILGDVNILQPWIEYDIWRR